MSPQGTRPKPTEGRKEKTYDYFVVPKTGKAICFTSKVDACTVSRLWEAGRSDFHDAELQNATEEINEILEGVERDNEDKGRHLSFVKFQSRLMLAWTRHDELLGADDDRRAVAKALKLRARRP